ncbi:SDR family NAD(P)-dependent oxidoreductase [Halegenticoccus soli]|uniref:SDR family NAD(P)-dependent oxidoreductase n=1 Tax=Halegenticoccus soli TaxID=1985678 RepID=UPI000C6DC95C|nr:SDR family oxidoreductase [Halegenticoccus soli]
MAEFTHTPVTVDGKVAVVVGGTSGIGRAIALGFAADGADVVATSRTPERVATTADELRELGADTREITCDVTDRESLERLRDAVREEFGTVDVLVNSPSYIARKPVREVTEEQWRDVFEVQLDGTYRATQVFADGMDSGSVINMASLSSLIAIPNLAAYSTAKGGIDAFTRVAAKELGPDIRVNAIRPGFIQSDQTEGTYTEGTPRFEEIRRRTTQGRMGRADEITGAAIYLASDAASYTTGEILTVDDGFTADAFDA